MSASRERSGPGGVAAAVGAALAAVVCCALPLLVAGGALGTVGTALRNPWLITVGVVLLVTGTVYVRRRRARRRSPGLHDRCPPVPHSAEDDCGRHAR